MTILIRLAEKLCSKFNLAHRLISLRQEPEDIQKGILGETVISYRAGKDNYEISIGSYDPNFFAKVVQLAKSTNKKGEELVAALLVQPEHSIKNIQRETNKGRHNGPGDEPAAQSFRKLGSLSEVYHCKTLTPYIDMDASVGVIQRFNHKGSLTEVYHFRNGLHHDLNKDEPAVQSFDPHGRLVEAFHYQNDKVTSRLSDAEIKTWHAAREERKKKTEVVNSPPKKKREFIL